MSTALLTKNSSGQRFAELDFPTVEQTPPTVNINALHGLTEDIPVIVPEEYQKDFEEQFSAELIRRNINPYDAKQRIHTCDVSVANGNTYIHFQKDRGGEFDTICIKGIEVQLGESRIGGGAGNLMKTLDRLVDVIGCFKGDDNVHHLIENALEKNIVASTVANDTVSKQFSLRNLDLQQLSGQLRTSHVFQFRGRPFYFTQREALLNESEMINASSALPEEISSIQSRVIQQMSEKEMSYLLDSVRKNIEEPEKQRDNVFLLMPKDLIQKGLNDPEIQAILAGVTTISFNLEEAAILLGEDPDTVGEEEGREEFSQRAAKEIHRFGVENLVITDAEHGAYVSHLYKENIEWQHYGIENDVEKYLQYIPKEHLLAENAVGCGDSFAGTVDFCIQVLGAKNWNFIIPFASKIAAIVYHLKEANIHDIDPEVLKKVFEDALEERGRPNEGWTVIETDIGKLVESTVEAVRLWFLYNGGVPA